MLRIVAVLVFAALVSALFLVPGVSREQLAVKQMADLVAEEATLLDQDGSARLDPETGEPVTKELWKVVFESDAMVDATDPAGRAVRVFKPGGSGFNAIRTRFPDLEERGMQDPEVVAYLGESAIWPIQSIEGIIRALRSKAAEHAPDVRIDAFTKTDPDGMNFQGTVQDGQISLEVNQGGAPVARVVQPWRPITQRSLLPPLVAIFLAILLRRPIVALFAGVWVGAFLLERAGGEGAVTAVGTSFVDVFAVFFREQVTKQSRIEIVLFVVFMLAMVGVITRAGGIRGIMDRIAVLAKDARKTQIATWFMGLSIFFDDYANSILVGSTMRPLADKFRVAREKLAYIVDSTAAPVAGVSILSTWIAFEVSTFSAQLPDAGLAPSDGYAVFLQTLPYRFYCWFTLLFVGMIVFSGRDFGPMLKAERRARGGKLLRDGARPMVGGKATELEQDASVTPKASTALVPLIGFILATLGTIVWNGAMEIGLLVETESFPYAAVGSGKGTLLETLTGILYGGSGEFPLLVGALVGFGLAAAMAMLRGLGPGSILEAALRSLLAMGTALVILYLAWMVGAVCEEIGTAKYLSATLGTSTPYVVLPIVMFLLAGLIAFSTGSSWSTMTILLPLVIGLAYALGTQEGLTDAAQRANGLLLVTICIGAVLEGAIFGDHCSPISDTTVMSSIACASDHVDHVRTQAPYALLTMSVALVFGYFPVVFIPGYSPWIALVVGTAILALVVRLYGKKATADDGADPFARELAQ